MSRNYKFHNPGTNLATRTVSEHNSYDVWGRRRNPANWNDYNVPTPSLINRGYTGHEMLDGFGLINMNGRMYDPVIGRVLSPDKVVQAPGYTQSYNRYSYCMNNPLRYTDPSGWLALANFDNALFDISNAWAERVNNPESYLYTSGYDGYSGGGGGGYSYNSSGGFYTHNGEVTTWNDVYDNYIRPNSINYTGQMARNFVAIVNKMDGFSLSVENNRVVVEYAAQPDNQLACNGSECSQAGYPLNTYSKSFNGILHDQSLAQGNGAFALDVSGAYYEGNISLDPIVNLFDLTLAGYDLNIYATFSSAKEENQVYGKVCISHGDESTYFNLKKYGRNSFNNEDNNFKEIGSLSLNVSPNVNALYVNITFTLQLNKGSIWSSLFPSSSVQTISFYF